MIAVKVGVVGNVEHLASTWKSSKLIVADAVFPVPAVTSISTSAISFPAPAPEIV